MNNAKNNAQKADMNSAINNIQKADMNSVVELSLVL